MISAPLRVYSPKDSSTPRRRASSATIRFATDPNSVRFPASVVDMANPSHVCTGSGKLGTNGRKSNTAGTLEIRLLSTAATSDSATIPCSATGWSRAKRSSLKPRTSSVPVTTKRPAKKTSNDQSISAKMRSGSQRRVTSSRPAATSAASGMSTPTTKATSISAVAAAHLRSRSGWIVTSALGVSWNGSPVMVRRWTRTITAHAITIPPKATGVNAAAKSTNEIPDAMPMIIFCGLPVIVAVEPILAAVASPIR